MKFLDFFPLRQGVQSIVTPGRPHYSRKKLKKNEFNLLSAGRYIRKCKMDRYKPMFEGAGFFYSSRKEAAGLCIVYIYNV